MPIKKVLVVDDSPTERFFLTDLLRKQGYDVLTAESGELGVAVAKTEKPDHKSGCSRAGCDQSRAF